MKIMLIIETPEDDDPHYPRIARALQLYVSRSKANNTCWADRKEPIDSIGMNGGPNTLECGGDVRVTERRIDIGYFKFKVYDRLPRCLKRIFASLAWQR